MGITNFSVTSMLLVIIFIVVKVFSMPLQLSQQPIPHSGDVIPLYQPSVSAPVSATKPSKKALHTMNVSYATMPL